VCKMAHKYISHSLQKGKWHMLVLREALPQPSLFSSGQSSLVTALEARV
jgi:hypothetical protein